jgi:DNA-binding MarR family transcriptional regulator
VTDAAPRRTADQPLDESALEHVAGYLVARAQAPLRRCFFEGIGEPFGLRPVEFTILVLVATNDDVTLKRLTQTLNVTAPNITVVLDRLEARGLVQRVRSHSDRRSMIIRLLPSGERIVRDARDASRTMEDTAFAGFSPAERRTLLALMRRLVATPR